MTSFVPCQVKNWSCYAPSGATHTVVEETSVSGWLTHERCLETFIVETMVIFVPGMTVDTFLACSDGNTKVVSPP